MAKDVFLVDAGVVALLALERLLALVVEHVLLQDRQDGTISACVRATVGRASLRVRLCDGHLERGPALAAVVALQALEELRVAALVRVHVEAQVLLSEEARAADPAVVGPEERLEGFIVAAARR